MTPKNLDPRTAIRESRPLVYCLRHQNLTPTDTLNVRGVW